MAISDDDITTSDAQGEGVADGGSNPGGHDGGADGSAHHMKGEGEGLADGQAAAFEQVVDEAPVARMVGGRDIGIVPAHRCEDRGGDARLRVELSCANCDRNSEIK